MIYFHSDARAGSFSYELNPWCGLAVMSYKIFTWAFKVAQTPLGIEAQILNKI